MQEMQVLNFMQLFTISMKRGFPEIFQIYHEGEAAEKLWDICS